MLNDRRNQIIQNKPAFWVLYLLLLCDPCDCLKVLRTKSCINLSTCDVFVDLNYNHFTFKKRRKTLLVKVDKSGHLYTTCRNKK